MKFIKTIQALVVLFFYVLNFTSCKKQGVKIDSTSEVMVKLCVENNKISKDWRNALTTRQSKTYLDSLSKVERHLTKGEQEWNELISSRTERWNEIRDSLKVPFEDTYISDTIYVYLGYQGSDDGFTYKFQTVCFDLTALLRQYGSAKDSINTNRMDRIFAHEYTHLLSKEWAKKKELKLPTFRDSILWECMYEGMGMYRSMSPKWFPVRDSLSNTSSEAFEKLYPIFSERLIAIDTLKELSKTDKKGLNKNLSRGSMKQKWGALPVGVWLAMEADGDDKNLIKWINKGPDAIIPLAKKYLIGESKIKFEKVFPSKLTDQE